ncbi:hypothetical protein FOMG_16239 [Fusarium oxysporum f. sp. melonis 26406]|uniref:Uncharacterized protein n=1 Tax=Fusarium oxysporum f. sp. melonis 26406 TaxID=1089452 RepID=W9ZF40_FUSOX|nr:hypothetical protein FOMG_16239 [Fusarium oxysporum f. sp. melonis 26406]
MYAAPAGPHASLLDVVKKQDHARKRRYMSHVMAIRNLETLENKVTDKIERLLKQFDQISEKSNDSGNQVVDFRKWTNLFTLGAIMDIALSHHLGCSGCSYRLRAYRRPEVAL